MKTYRGLFILVLIVIQINPSWLFATDVETVGEASYAHFQAYMSTVDVFQNKIALDNNGFASLFSKIVEQIGGEILIDVSDNAYFGGVLLWASHGSSGYVECEQYSTPTQVDNRIYFLTQGQYFRQNDLVKIYSEIPGYYAVALTSVAINYLFSSANGIALIAACDGKSTGGKWNGRVKVSYDGIVYDIDAKDDMTAFLTCLTGGTNGSDYSKMTVMSAKQGNQEFDDDDKAAKTALIPWIASYYPPSALSKTSNTVTVNFGTKMDETDNPFTVTGDCTIISNKWNSNSQAELKVDCNKLTTINVKLDKTRIKSSKGIYLRNNFDMDYAFQLTSSWDTWGFIKSLYGDGGVITISCDTLLAGVYEPRSSQYYRLCWKNIAPPSGEFNVLRSNNNDDNMYVIGRLEYGDTVFIDSTVTEGNTYKYRIVTADNDSITYSDESSLGLIKISEISLTDITSQDNNPKTGHMVADENYIYLAAQEKIKKIDISNPYSPSILCTRDLSSYIDIDSMETITDIGISVENGLLFILTNKALLVIDLNDILMPVISSYNVNGGSPYCRGLAITKNVIHIASMDTTGLISLNFSNPMSLEMWLFAFYSGSF